MKRNQKYTQNHQMTVGLTIIENNGDKEITHVIHLADIHIRLYARRQEYEDVFQRTYDSIHHKIKTHPNTVIVICGDVVHNKNELTPECITLTYNFFKQLGLLAPTFVIAGNHDALLNNLERMDSLSVIFYQRHIPNVHYLRDSGFYRYYNVVFVVNSLLTPEKEFLFPSHTLQDSIYIGLYHGGVGKFLTGCHATRKTKQTMNIEPLPFRMEGEISPKMFQGCDIVMLGDIHRCQYMNDEKTIAYSGSLVCQNWGEMDHPHGYLYWDILEKKSVFIEIHNPRSYSYIIIDEHGVATHKSWSCPLSDIRASDATPDFPVYGTFRVYIHPDVSPQKHKIIGHLGKEFPTAHFIYQQWPSSIDQRTGIQMIESDNKHEEPNEIVLRYLQKAIPEDCLRDSVYTMIMNEWKTKTDMTHVKDWKIVQLRFDYLFGYGSSNTIQFFRVRHGSVIGVFGENSHGKSTIIDIITWMLFGKITRYQQGNSIPKEIINEKSNEAHCELVLQTDKSIFVLRKKCTRQKNKKISINEKLFQYKGTFEQFIASPLSVDEYLENITEEHRKKTDKTIGSMIGSMDIFLMTSVLLQQRDKNFREMNQSARKDFLFTLFNLDFFEDVKDSFDTKHKTSKARLQILEERMCSMSSDTLHLDFSEQDKKINSLHERKQRLQQTRQENEETQKAITDSLPPDPHRSILSMKENIERHERLQKQNNMLETKYETIQSEIIRIRTMCNQIDVVRLKCENERLEVELTTAPCPAVDEKEIMSHPLYKKWIRGKRSSTEWKAFYTSCISRKERFGRLRKNYENERLIHEQETQDLFPRIPASTISDIIPMKHPFGSKQWLEEWQSYQTKHDEFVHQLKNTEEEITKLKNENPYAPYTEDIISLLETNIPRINEIASGCRTLRNAICMAQEKIKLTNTVSFNSDCWACVANPLYKDKETLLDEINRLTKQYSEKQKDMNTFLSDILPGFQSTEDTEKDMEYLNRIVMDSHRCAKSINVKVVNLEKVISNMCSFIKTFEQQKRCNEEREYMLRYETHTKSFTDSPLVKEYEETVELLKDLPIYDTISKVYTYKDFLTKKTPIQERIKHNADQIQTYNDAQLSLESLTQESVGVTKEKSILEGQLKTIENDKILLERYSKDWDRLQKSIRSQKTIDDEIRVLDETLIEGRLVLMRLKERLCDVESIEKERQSVERECEVYKRVVGVLNRDHLPLYLIEAMLPEMEDLMNRMVGGFVHQKVIFRLVDKEILFGFQDTTQPERPALFMGGMETFILDIGLKMALGAYSRLGRPHLFIIDEGLSVLDKERISGVRSLFEFITEYSDYLVVVSHIPQIRDFVDSIVQVRKDPTHNQSFLDIAY